VEPIVCLDYLGLLIPTADVWVWCSAAFVCLSVCLFLHTISQKPMPLGRIMT